jgi:hypothetical protein
MTKICFLSGLEIPKNKHSVEHYAPKSRVPKFIAQQSYNLFPAIKIVNFIKSNLMPCEWHDQRDYRVAYAYKHYKLKQDDKKILRHLMQHGFPDTNPCESCICSKYVKYCVNKELLERSR